MPSNIFRATVTGLSSNATGGSQTNSSGFPTWYADIDRTPFNIGVGVTINSSAIVYSVQHTFDYLGNLSSNFVGFLASAATWFEHSTISAATSNANGNYAFGVSAIRLFVTAGSSTGTCTLTLVPAG
jgi:hypothetical protein